MGPCHHCFKHTDDRRKFTIKEGGGSMVRLLCEETCAPRWAKFVAAWASMRKAAK